MFIIRRRKLLFLLICIISNLGPPSQAPSQPPLLNDEPPPIVPPVPRPATRKRRASSSAAVSLTRSSSPSSTTINHRNSPAVAVDSTGPTFTPSTQSIPPELRLFAASLTTANRMAPTVAVDSTGPFPPFSLPHSAIRSTDVSTNRINSSTAAVSLTRPPFSPSPLPIPTAMRPPPAHSPFNTNRIASTVGVNFTPAFPSSAVFPSTTNRFNGVPINPYHNAMQFPQPSVTFPYVPTFAFPTMIPQAAFPSLNGQMNRATSNASRQPSSVMMVHTGPPAVANRLLPNGHILSRTLHQLKKGKEPWSVTKNGHRDLLKHCNGTRLQVKKLGRNLITAAFIAGPRKGETVFIPRIHMDTNNKDLAFIMRRTQFPLKLAFCMSINKAQGQPLECVGIDLEDEVFSHGMLYVALSRSKTKAGVKVFTKDGVSTARNIVDLRVLT